MNVFTALIKKSVSRLAWSAVVTLLAISRAPAQTVYAVGADIGPKNPERPVVVIDAPVDTAPEGGDAGVFRISRNDSAGSLLVNLIFSGNATLDDYTVSSVGGFDKVNTRVVLPDGRTFADVLVKAVDDIPAEADETIILTLNAGTGYTIGAANQTATITIPSNDFIVTGTDDDGEGSLRQAIVNANALPGLNTITFDSKIGPFSTPQTVRLNSELPELTGEVVINGRIPGRLWKPVGVTVNGEQRWRVFSIPAGANVTIGALTVADGRAHDGGGILNRGTLVIKDATLIGNSADQDGGGLANFGGSLTVINSTFAENRAGRYGGGLADVSGATTVTNSTFSGNSADRGGGLFSSGSLLLRNTILANSAGGKDCVNIADLNAASTNNLIIENDRCGVPISSADPELEPLGGYNGPTHTFALPGGSPAINLGDNASAVDEHGQPLVWDQRGGGDPRFVAGFTDIGAFEHQAFPVLTVDTVEDIDLRGCARAGKADCSLRGAIDLANAAGKPATITFDPRLFSKPQTITLTRPLADIATDLVIDGGDGNGVEIRADTDFEVFNTVPDAEVTLIGVTLQNGK